MKVKHLKTPSHWQSLEYHEYSDLTDFGQGIDTEAVIGHMSVNGWDCSERITLFGGKILDGRHKHSCAQKAEVEPLFQEFTGSNAEAVAFVRKKLLRQHLTTDQRALVAAKLSNLNNGHRPSSFEEGGDEEHDGAPSHKCEGGDTTRAEAARQMNVSTRSVDNAKALLNKCCPAIQRAYRTQEVSLTDAASVATLKPEQQEKALDAFRAGRAHTLAAYAKTHKPKKKTAPPADDGLPKSVSNALADTFHLESARVLAKMRKQARSVISWSVWLDLESLDKLLDQAEQCFLSAAPSKACPECKGQKKIEKEACKNCRGGGFMGAHAC